MRAMVFAAGIGSRLKHLTQNRPKCLMEIGKTTMLETVVERLKLAGVTDVMINVHHLPEMIVDYVRQRKNFGMNVSFSREDILLDTGGGLKRARNFFEHETAFFIHNSDVYSDLDLVKLFDSHTKSGAHATLAVMKRESKRGLYFDSNEQLVGWTGEEAVTPPASSSLLAFSGIHVASPAIFDFMADEDIFSIIVPYLKAARAGRKIVGYRMTHEFWMDMGTPSDLEELRVRLQ